MIKRDSAVTGSAGEHYVLYQLHRHGLIAALAPRGAHDADIIVFSPEMSVGSMIQVKTRTYGRDGGWHMREKHEAMAHPRMFYALVDLEPDAPVVYVVPSGVVADVLRAAHQLGWQLQVDLAELTEITQCDGSCRTTRFLLQGMNMAGLITTASAGTT